MKKSISLWLALVLLALNPAYGQLICSLPPSVIEGPYDILPMDGGTFAINIDRDEKVIHFFFTDENLKKKNEAKYSFAEFVHRIRYKIKEDKVYVLFNWDGARNFHKIFMIIDAKSGKSSLLPVHNSFMTYIDDFYILNESIAMIGFLQAEQSFIQIMKINNNSLEMNSVHIQMKILDMAESDGYLDILASSQTNNGGQKLQLLTLNEEGERLYTIEAETGFEKKHLVKSAILQSNGSGKFKAVGTYSDSKKSHFSGYFYWEMDYTLQQEFKIYPASTLQGFGKSDVKKIHRQIKYELTKGFGIVKILEEKGQLAIVSIPNIGPQYWKKYPRIYNNSLFHVLYLNDSGEKMYDEIFAFKRSLKSPYVDYDFLNNPPFYMVDGSLYFLYNEEFTRTPSLIVHNLRSNAKKPADELYPSIAKTTFYKTQYLKENEIIVYGLQENDSKKKTLFLDKLTIKEDSFR